MGCCSFKNGSVEEVGLKQAGKAKPASAEVIAKKIEQAKKIRTLALRECGLKQVPPNATTAELQQLKSADLTLNALKTLPDTISAWSALTKLQCAQNALTVLPDSIGELAALENLNASENTLSTLPASFARLGKLQMLHLEGNRLGPRLPESLFGGALSAALKELNLARNALEELPAAIGEFSVLERLILSENKLVALVPELGSLSKLQHLDAAENKIVAIPGDFLVGLTSLSELWLKGNPMDRLVLQQAPGFEPFLARRKQRLDAKIEANVVGRVDLAVCGLD